MNILFIDNQQIKEEHLKYLKEEKPVQIEGNRQYILSLARNVLKKHNVFFPFQNRKADIAHVFDGFSQPVFFRKELPTVYSLLQPPISKVRVIKQLPVLFSETAGFRLFKLWILGLIPQSWFCRYLKRFDKILTVTNYEKKYLIEHGIPEYRISKLGVGIDYNLFKPMEKERMGDIFVVSYFGAISAFKGIEIVYKNIKLFKNRKDIKFKLALDLYSQRRSNIVKKLRKFKNVEIFGHLTNVKNFLNESDLVFLPYPTMLGNFSIPFTLLEAMSTGNLVLTTNLPPLKEIIEDYKNGFICTINEMKNKIEWIHENKDSLGYIKRNARKFIIENCDWGRITKKLFSIYNQVVDS